MVDIRNDEDSTEEEKCISDFDVRYDNFLAIGIVYPQIRNYAPNMIQKRKESASLVKRGTVHRMSA